MFVPSAKNNYVVKAAKRAHKDVFGKPVPSENRLFVSGVYR
jgi:hypothetical protein